MCIRDSADAARRMLSARAAASRRAASARAIESRTEFARLMLSWLTRATGVAAVTGAGCEWWQAATDTIEDAATASLATNRMAPPRRRRGRKADTNAPILLLSLIHISEPTRLLSI